MDYFKYFPYTRYVFGNEAEEIGTGKVVTEVVQDISRYVDVIDEVKRSKAFSTQYYIQENERPDNVSQLLYGNPSYHWTFWLMNDHIREQGWPLTYRQMQKQLERDFPGMSTGDIIESMNNRPQNLGFIEEAPQVKGMSYEQMVDLGLMGPDQDVGMTAEDLQNRPSFFGNIQNKIGSGLGSLKDFAMNNRP